MKKYPIYKLRYRSKEPAKLIGKYPISLCPSGIGHCAKLPSGFYMINYFDNTASGSYGLITYSQRIAEKRIKL